MSNLRYEVPSLSRDAITRRADLVRAQYQLVTNELPAAFPVVHYIERVLQPLLPEFILEIVEQDELPDVEGLTWPDSRHIILRRDVYEGAVAGEGRARFTVSHELGHLLLHKGLPFARSAHDSQRPPAYADSEWQANWFAGALLMPADQLKLLHSVNDVVVTCGVSLQAAETRLSKLGMKKPQF